MGPERAPSLVSVSVVKVIDRGRWTTANGDPRRSFEGCDMDPHEYRDSDVVDVALSS